MSSNPHTTTISLPDNPLLSLCGNDNTSVDATIEKQEEVIIIQDVNVLCPTQVSHYNFFASIGLIPNKLIFTNWTKRLFLASCLSVLFSIWVSNQFILSVFILLNILNFITSLFTDKQTSFKQKLAYLVSEGLLVGLVSVIGESLMGKVPIFSTQFSLSLVHISAFFMSLYYMYEIVKRLYPITSLSKSKTFMNFVLSIKDGIKYGQNKFDERQEKDTLTTL